MYIRKRFFDEFRPLKEGEKLVRHVTNAYFFEKNAEYP
jgi:hypothetical protein